MSLKKAAARDSFPGGFVVSIRRYSCSHCTAKSAYLFMRSAGMFCDAKEGADCCALSAAEEIARHRKYTAEHLLLPSFAMVSPEILGSTAYAVFISASPKLQIGRASCRERV